MVLTVDLCLLRTVVRFTQGHTGTVAVPSGQVTSADMVD